MQRAIRTVRSRAAEWHIAPERMGVWGFSAGGHLASTAATHFDAGKPDGGPTRSREAKQPPGFRDPRVPGHQLSRKRGRTRARGPCCSERSADPALARGSVHRDAGDAQRRRRRSCFTPTPTRPCRSRTASTTSSRCDKAGVPAEMHIFRDGRPRRRHAHERRGPCRSGRRFSRTGCVPADSSNSASLAERHASRSSRKPTRDLVVAAAASLTQASIERAGFLGPAHGTA